MRQGGPREAAAAGEPAKAGSDGFLSKLADLFSSSDPEKERRRLLKQTARALRKLGAHYYNPKTEQAETGLAKLFYEFYKAFAPAQRILQNARNSSVLKSVVIDSALANEQLALKEGLSEDSLRRRIEAGSFDQVRTEASNELASLFACFDINRTKQINDTYGSLALLLDLILFDYYYFLRKFDPQLSESRRNYVPRFRATNSQYITGELEEFLEILPAVDLAQDWPHILEVLKAYRQVEAVPRDAWKRAVHLIRKLQGSRELELAVQLFTHNPFFKAKPRAHRENVVEDYLSRFKLQTEATLQKLSKERKANTRESLLAQLFAGRSYMRLANFNEETNKGFSQKLLGGFVHVLPLNCFHSFLDDYAESDLGKTVEFLLIPAKWADNSHSRVVSDAFHGLQSVGREIVELDETLSEEHEFGRRLASVVSRAQKNQQAQYLARRMIQKINAQTRDLLLRASQQAVGLGKEIKLVLDDTEWGNSKLIINWRELAGRAKRDLRQMFVSSYKLLYFLVQLFKLYL
jgi:GGDEF domain-containing protein